MKIAVIGGGSTYTPELIDGIARLSGQVAVGELVLVDPDESRLAVVGPVCTRIMASYGHPAELRWTTGLDDGLDGAARRPGAGTRPGHCPAAASARRPPELAGWRRRCAPSPWSWTSPSAPASAPWLTRGSSISPTRLGS
jgi:hypothetical protein